MSVLAPTPMSTTADTVTLSRGEWEAFLDRLEDEADLASVRQSMADRAQLGDAEYQRLCYRDDEAGRMLEGVQPLTIWRERAALTQRALAAEAAVSPSYLAEIEAGRKPGSAAALKRLADVLRVPMDYLVNAERQEPSAEA